MGARGRVDAMRNVSGCMMYFSVNRIIGLYDFIFYSALTLVFICKHLLTIIMFKYIYIVIMK